MTREMHPSEGSSVLEITDEKGSGAVTPPLIDPQFLKKKEDERSRQCSVGDVFLAASYVSLLLELLASGYTLWCSSHPRGDLTLFKVTLSYFILTLLVNVILVANSVVELRDLRAREKEMTEKERRVKYAMEWLTVVSAALWVVLCAISVAMTCGIHNPTLQYTSLVISLVAPFMCSVAGFLRVYDTYLSYRKERDTVNSLETDGEHPVTLAQKTAADKRAKSHFVRASLYGIISVFEALHFIVHIWEAYILVGNTHKFFYITERAFLVSQVVLGAVFIVLAVAERVLENATEPDLATERVVSLTTDQIHNAGSGGVPPQHANDDTSPVSTQKAGDAEEAKPASSLSGAGAASPVGGDKVLAAGGL